MDTRDYFKDDFEINRRNPQPESIPTPDEPIIMSGSVDPEAVNDPIPEVEVEDGPVDEVTVAEVAEGTTTEPIEEPAENNGGDEPKNDEPKDDEPGKEPVGEPVENPKGEPVEEPKADTAAQLLALVSAQLEGIEAKFDAKIANDEHKNELFNKMYAELADYKRDLYSKLLKPFITETIRLLEDYERFIDRMQGASLEQIGRFIQDLPDDLNNLLENNGVERYSDDTEKFNPRTQRVVKTIPTDDPALDNVIAERVRQGYVWNGVTLKPETVKIYKYTK